MKRAVILLCLLLVLSHSDGLRCYCGGQRMCAHGLEEVCHGIDELCARVIITAGAKPKYFNGCIFASMCFALYMPGISSAFCCRTDLCNR